MATRTLFPRKLRRRLGSLFSSPLFWLITFLGNACILGGALLFYGLEHESNPALKDMLDSLVWAVGMVTTVGGGEIHAVTVGGKILTMGMMMGGALFLWSYMAIFIGALVEPELGAIQREVGELERELTEHKKE